MASPIPTSPQDPPQDSSRDHASDASLVFRLRHVLLVMRERWIGASAIALVVCSLAAFTMLRRPPVFSATAALMVDRAERVVDIKAVVETDDPYATDSTLPTHMEQMRGHTFLARVVASLTPDERKLLTGPAPVTAPGDVPAPPPTDAQFEGLIKGTATITNPRRSTLISVTAAHGDPGAAQLIANRICEQYVLHLIDRSGVSNSAALTFLRERSEELRKKVESSELALQGYREKHNLVVVEENQKIVVERISSLSTSATEARVTRLALEAQLTQMETLVKAGPEAFLRSSPTESAALATIQKEIDQLVAQRAVLSERYGKRHPVMLDNDRQREALEKIRQQNLETHMQSAVSDLRNQVDRARTNEQQLAKEVSAAEKEALRLDELAVQYNVLRREMETSRQMYNQILLRQGETAVSSQLRNTNVRIADRAPLPKNPVSLDKTRIAFIVCFLGLACMVGYPVMADLADQRIKSWLHVESYLDALLLAEIGVVKSVKEGDRTHVVSADGDSATAELFRALYSQISLTSQRPAPKTVLVTSTVPAEGKSFVAANLAAVFASHGKRTLLIDCDFRRPSLHRAFNQDNKHGLLRWLGEPPGTADILANPLLGITEVSTNLSILRSGGVSRRATELIENPRVVALLETLQNRFDILVMDTPPAGVFADAESFARLADEIVYVCRFGSANRPHARQVLERLDKTDAVVLGVVLNAMPARRQAEAYYYKYGYSGAKYQKEYTSSDSKQAKG